MSAEKYFKPLQFQFASSIQSTRSLEHEDSCLPGRINFACEEVGWKFENLWQIEEDCDFKVLEFWFMSRFFLWKKEIALESLW